MAAEYQEVISEINVLRYSTQIYDITSSLLYDSSSEEHAITSYDEEMGMVRICVARKSSLSFLAHELKHAYQFETGQLSLGSKKGYPFYDLTDEEAAYKRGELFGGKPMTYDSKTYQLLKNRTNAEGKDSKYTKRAYQKFADDHNAVFLIDGVLYKSQKEQ